MDRQPCPSANASSSKKHVNASRTDKCFLDVERSIATLHEETNASQTREAELKQELIALKAEKHAASKEMASKLEEVTKANEVLANQHAAAVEKSSRLEAALKLSQKAMGKKEEALEKSEQLREKLLHDYGTASKELAEAKVLLKEEKKTKDELKREIEKVSIAPDLVNSQVTELNELVEGLRGQLSEERSSKAKRVEELQTKMHAELASFKVQLQEVKRTNDKVAKKLNQQIENQLKEVEKLIAAKIEKEKLLKETSKKLKDSERAKDLMVGRLQAMVEECAGFQSALKTADDEKTAAEAARKQLEGELVSLQEGLVAAKAEKEVALKEVAGKLKKVERAKKDLAKVLIAAEEKSAGLTVAVKSAQEDKMAKEEALEKSQSQLISIRAELDQLIEKRLKERQELTAMKGIIEGKDDALINAQKELEKAKASREEADKLFAVTKETLLEFAKKRSIHLRPEMLNDPGFPVYFFKKLDGSMESIQELLKEHESATAQLKADKKKLQKELSDLHAASKVRQDELRSRVTKEAEETVKSTLESTRIESEALRVKYGLAQERLRQYAAEIDRQREQIKQLDLDKTKHEKSVADMTSLQERFKAQLVSLKDAHNVQLKQKQHEINSLNAQLNFAGVKLRDLEAEQNRLKLRSVPSSSEHIYEAINKDSQVFARPSTSGLPMSRRDSMASNHSYASLRQNLANSLSTSSGALKNASSLTLPCADEMGKLLSTTDISKMYKFGDGLQIIERLGSECGEVEEDVDGRARELKWRNSLVHPHLRSRSTYPTEMALAAKVTEEQLKIKQLDVDRTKHEKSVADMTSLQECSKAQLASLKAAHDVQLKQKQHEINCLNAQLNVPIERDSIERATRGRVCPIVNSFEVRRETEEDVDGRAQELKWRNSQLPLHLRSTYVTELSVTAKVSEEELKNVNATAMASDAVGRLPAATAQFKIRPGRRSRSLSPPLGTFLRPASSSARRLPVCEVHPNSPRVVNVRRKLKQTTLSTGSPIYSSTPLLSRAAQGAKGRKLSSSSMGSHWACRTIQPRSAAPSSQDGMATDRP